MVKGVFFCFPTTVYQWDLPFSYWNMRIKTNNKSRISKAVKMYPGIWHPSMIESFT